MVAATRGWSVRRREVYAGAQPGLPSVPRLCTRTKVTDDGDALGHEDRAHAGHGLDDPGPVVGAERLAVVVLEPFVQYQQLVGNVADEFGGPLLARQRNLLDGAASNPLTATVPAPDLSAFQPRRQTLRPGPTQGGRGLNSVNMTMGPLAAV